MVGQNQLTRCGRRRSVNAFPAPEHNKEAVLAARHSSAGSLCTRVGHWRRRPPGYLAVFSTFARLRPSASTTRCILQIKSGSWPVLVKRVPPRYAAPPQRGGRPSLAPFHGLSHTPACDLRGDAGPCSPVAAVVMHVTMQRRAVLVPPLVPAGVVRVSAHAGPAGSVGPADQDAPGRTSGASASSGD
jgi:hypothetical protein